MAFATNFFPSILVTSRRLQICFLLLVIGGVCLFGLYFFRNEFYLAITAYIEWAHSLGNLGLCFVGLAVFICQFLPMPFLFIGLSVVSSFTFGFFQSIAPMFIGTIAGMFSVWMVCLSGLRPWLMSHVTHVDVFRHLHRELDAHQWKTILIIRFSPIPVGMQNFVLSLVLSGGDSLWRYMIGSCVIVLPETLVYIGIGQTIKNVSDFVLGETEPSAWESGLMVLQLFGGFCFLAGVVTFGSRLIRDVYANLSEPPVDDLQLVSSNTTGAALPRRKHFCGDVV